MSALDIKSFAKTATICSDHFELSSYTDINSATQKRRLLSNAVPSKILPIKEVQIFNETVNDTDIVKTKTISISEKKTVPSTSSLTANHNNVECSDEIFASSSKSLHLERFGLLL